MMGTFRDEILEAFTGARAGNEDATKRLSAILKAQGAVLGIEAMTALLMREQAIDPTVLVPIRARILAGIRSRFLLSEEHVAEIIYEVSKQESERA